MKIISFKGEYLNFGDELNYWMWPRLLPDFFDESDDIVFLGIGSIIGERRFAPEQKKIIFGSGFVPEYHEKPDVNGPDWHTYFVRGPYTAQRLGLAPELSLGDSAILLRTLVDYKANTREVISFMPHWQSLDRGNWKDVCRKAGINLIDPRRPVEEVIAELLMSKLVITEAMHGAIVADCFRIPWVAVLPLNKAHRNKWYDWAGALGFSIVPHKLFPSSLKEARLSFLRKIILALPGQKLFDKVLTAFSALSLRKLACVPGTLSADDVIDAVTARMQAMVEKVIQDYGTVSSSQRELKRAERIKIVTA